MIPIPIGLAGVLTIILISFIVGLIIQKIDFFIETPGFWDIVEAGFWTIVIFIPVLVLVGILLYAFGSLISILIF
jgi:hypothetical protein